jgi:low affinity Fe/Cu permease
MTAWFDHFAHGTADHMGRPWAFTASVAVVILWAMTGPLFGWSDSWQLVVNTGTTIITFWMVFVIQTTQNRDQMATQAKLDEVIRVLQDARNEHIALERAESTEIRRISEEHAQQREDLCGGGALT